MRLRKELTLVTTFSKYLALGLFILLPIIGFYLGKYYEQNLDQQKILLLQTANRQVQPTPDESNANFPTVISQTKNIKLNTQISSNMNAVTITFPGASNTTYDKTIYHVKGNDFTILDLHFNNLSTTGQVQEFDTPSDNFINFVYESYTLDSAGTLMNQLDQSVGFYPQTIYDGAYEIFTNMHGIKMKRQYSLFPGYVTEKIEFVSPVPFDDKFHYRHYIFEAPASTLGENFDKSAFYTSPFTWVKNNPQQNFQKLDWFIDTIKNIGN